MTDFSLNLNEDQLQIQKWVHDFAEGVIRPVAEEWDEREEFPWPVVEEAAQIGLYGVDFLLNAMGDPTGLTLPVAIEELFWGDAGIGMAIMGSALAAAGIAGNGTPEQVMEWVPQCYGTADNVMLGAFCVSEPDAGSDVSSLRTRAVYDEAKDEWTLNGTKAWITNGGIADVHVVVASVDPELKSKGQASFIVPPNTPGLSMGQKYKKHGIRASHTSEVVLDDVKVPGSCLLGGKEKLDAKLARARENVSTGKQPAMATFEATRPAVGAQALGVARAAYEYSLDYAKERVRVRQADHHEPGDRVQARQHGHRDRRQPPPDLACRLARQERPVQERRGLDVEVEGIGDRGARHRGRHPDPRRLRLHPRVPRRALAPRREDPHDLRRHERDPAAGHLPGDLRPAYRVILSLGAPAPSRRDRAIPRIIPRVFLASVTSANVGT